MDNELKSILNNIKQARERGATQKQLDEMRGQIEALSENSLDQMSVLNQMASSVFKDMTSGIPGKNAIIAAFVTNNPLLAGAAQLYKDVKQYKKEASDKAQAEFNEQMKFAKSEFDKLEATDKKSKPDNQVLPDTPKLTPEGITVNNELPEQPQPISVPETDVSMLKPIKTTVDTILETDKASLKVLDELLAEWNGTGSEIVRNLEKQMDEQSKLLKVEEERAQQERDDKLKANEESPQPYNDTSSNVDEPVTNKNWKDNLLGIGEMVYGLGGLSTVAMALVAPIKKAAKLLRVGPLALVSAVWDFGNGFKDAEEILKKDKVSFVDRIVAGSSELLGGFADIIDWGANLLGFETDLGKKARESFLQLAETPLNILNKVESTIKEVFNGIDTNTKLVDMPGIIMSNVSGLYHRALDALWNDEDSIANMISEKAGNLKDKVVDEVTSWFKVVDGNTMSALKDEVTDGMTKFIDGIQNSISDYFKEFWNYNIDNIVKALSFVPMTDGVVKRLQELKAELSTSNVKPTTNGPTDDVIDRRRVENRQIYDRVEKMRQRRQEHDELTARRNNEKQVSLINHNNHVIRQSNSTTVVKGGGLSARDKNPMPFGRPLGFSN